MTFTPIPKALITRIHGHAEALARAATPDDQLAALFLLHCQCKDALQHIDEAPPVAALIPEEV